MMSQIPSSKVSVSAHFERILQELQGTLSGIAGEQVEQLAERILQSRHIFTAGAGRSGLMSRALAMRLMQLGLNAYVVGETVTPKAGKGDLLIIVSGSGETKGLDIMADKALQAEVELAAVTIFPESSIGRKANLIVQVPGAPKDPAQKGNTSTVQPMGSLFEQSVLLLFDGLMLHLMELRGGDTEAMFSNHANLE
ncbi:6-phospho-3-hexuloisomerase [Paenibacillus hunanensis]|uniref:6-phospho-3-hexuloisomerase n=1 Tax=Paenibacillus hunanensis TaxID=539262 RepID=A0ABU1J289_9BACL|nr:6-phospho-3-hexuloisomerase [Paenibacillus hunanensis]MDR6245524.1 6-phospho-3-hexuloisomerase [Paenibacillus hunanensis]